MKRCIVQLMLSALLVALTATSYRSIDRINGQASHSSRDEVLYFPNGEALRLISFGYSHVLAHSMWFSTINYFGKHLRLDRNYHWLNHMCSLVSEANPALLHVYEFCGLMLAWEAKLSTESIALLSRGIVQFPNSWKLYYLRGMTYLLFVKDQERAKEDLVRSSQLPDAPSSVVSLAAKKLSDLESPDTAVEFLIERIRSTKDELERKVLLSRLQEFRLDQDIALLEKAVEQYRQRQGAAPRNLQELIASGIVSSISRDPYGGTYYIDSQTGRVTSTSQQPLNSKGSE